MSVAFELQRIPTLFARVYREHLLRWASSGRQYATIHLYEYPDAVNSSDERWQGDVHLEVEMWAPRDGSAPKIVLRPWKHDDAERIREHCVKLPSIMDAHRDWGIEKAKGLH